MKKYYKTDFDIVVIKSFKDARSLSQFFKENFKIKQRFSKGYYKISFDYKDIIRTTYFWDKWEYKNSFWINTYSVNQFIALYKSGDNPSLLRETKQFKRFSNHG